MTARRLPMMIVVLALGCSVQPARAGTYTTWSCRNGLNEPTGYVGDWSRSSSGEGSFLVGHSTECQTVVPEIGPVPLRTVIHAVANNNPNLVLEDLAITTGRLGLSLDTARLWWRGILSSSGQVAAFAIDSNGSQRTLLDRRASFPLSADPDRGLPPTDILDLAGATGFFLRAACLATCQTAPPTLTAPLAEYDAYKVAFTVTDAAPPIGSATGDLLSAPVLTGQKSVTIDATDVGGGLHTARIVVDGEVRASTGVGDVRCRDIDTSNVDQYEFNTIRPCPLHDTVSVALDSTQLSEDAYHNVRVQVVDAGGNATNIAQRTVGVDNQPLSHEFFDRSTRRFQNPDFDIAAGRRLNGTGAASGARLRIYLPVTRSVRVRHGRRYGPGMRVTRAKARRTVRFSSSPRLRGVLTDSAQVPIAGGRVWTAVRIEGSDWQIVGRPHITSRTGRVGFRLPPESPSRQVNLVYFPYTDGHDQVVGRPVTVKVRAGVQLRLSPHHLRNGQRLHFHGLVDGVQPGRGVTAELQVKKGSRYTSFRHVEIRPASGGRFQTVYRFTGTRSRTRYRFRLVVLNQAGLPYARGASEVSTVAVTP
jgi:hypothetical protein